MSRQRWDTDVRGGGVASATAFVPDLERLAALATLPTWVAEDAEAHLLPAIRAEVDRLTGGVELDGTSVDESGCLVVRLTVEQSVPRGTVHAGVFALLGSIAETRTAVTELPEGRGFEVITGVDDGDTAFAAHGHRIRFEVLRRG